MNRYLTISAKTVNTLCSVDAIATKHIAEEVRAGSEIAIYFYNNVTGKFYKSEKPKGDEIEVINLPLSPIGFSAQVEFKTLKEVTVREETKTVIKHIGTEWYTLIQKHIGLSELHSMIVKIEEVYKNKNYIVSKNIQPRLIQNVFQSLRNCSPFDVKVIFLGQDPYAKNANGTAFSNDIATASLIAMQKGFKSLPRYKDNEDEKKRTLPTTLEHLTEQGVLLINLKWILNMPANWNKLVVPIIQSVVEYNKDVFLLKIGKEVQMNTIGIGISHDIEWACVEHPSFAARESRPWDCVKRIKQIDRHLKKQKLEIEWII